MPAATIGAELRAAALDSSVQPYLHHSDGVLTYADAYAAVRRVACGLIEQGIKPGDRLAVWASNDLPTALALLAISTIGAVVVPLNTRYTAHEAADIVGHARCAMILAPDHLVDRHLAREAITIAGDVPVVCLGSDVPDGALDWTRITGVDPERRSTELDHRIDAMNGEEVVIIQFTSGTTGQPKGALLRQGPILSTGRAWGETVGLTAGDVYPIMYPLAHIGGFKAGLLSTLLARAATILIPVVTDASVFATFRDYRVTVFNAPPTVLQAVLAAVAAGTLDKPAYLRTVVTGSTIVPPKLVRELVTTLGVQDVINAYGLTEASGACCMTRRGDPVDIVCETVGLPLDGVEVRITPGSEIGEIETRGPHVMAGYLDDPDATEAVMQDGWLRTGDTGWIDAAGHVRISGRATDMIIVGGFNVYPAEVEHLLLAHPAIGQVAVVGISDQRLGEVPVAFVIPTDRSLPESGQWIAWARKHLAGFKVPRHIWTLDTLPLNNVGKVDKTNLTQRARDLVTAPRSDCPTN